MTSDDLIQKLSARVVELAAELDDEKKNRHEVELRAQRTIGDSAWNDAIRAAADLAENAGEKHWKWRREEISGRIRTLLRNEGGEK